MAKTIFLVVIDPQNSFCKVVDPAQQQVIHEGELCVPGAWDDMSRLGVLVDRVGAKIEDIFATMDNHHDLHIAHPCWLKAKGTGAPPPPFTCMSENNGVITGSDGVTYEVFNPAYDAWTVQYLRSLATGGRYPHVIWPPHCLIGSKGATIVEPVFESFLAWERKYHAFVNYTAKGSNYRVEHFSAVRAEVADPEDITNTGLNSEFIKLVSEGDIILLAGEALSHCLANTVRDIANTFAQDEFIRKCVLLTDCSSNVPGYENLGTDFVTEMTKRGMQTTTSVDFLA